MKQSYLQAQCDDFLKYETVLWYNIEFNCLNDVEK